MFYLKVYKKPFSIFFNIVQITLVNKFKHCLGIKIKKITVFWFKKQTVCLKLNRTGRAYDIISHPEVCLNPYQIQLMRIKQISFKTEFDDLLGSNLIN